MMSPLENNYKSECALFQFLGSPKSETNIAIPSQEKVYAQTYNNITDILFDKSDTNHGFDLPPKPKMSPYKEWLHRFSIKLSKTPLLIYSNNKFYCFNGIYHEPYCTYTFDGIIASLLLDEGISPTSSDIDFIVNNLKYIVPSKSYIGPVNHPEFFLYTNGMVNVHTEQLQPITPYYFATGAINANFSPPLLNCHPVFDRFLNRITGRDNILILRIWEFLAYVISPEYRLRIIFCLIGVGGAGKSVLLKIIQALLTPSLVTNMSMANLATKGFSESELENKRVCIASDEGNFNFNTQSAARLKRISGGGETITSDVKMKAQTTFMVTAKLLVASNYPIHRSAAAIDPYLKSRMKIIPFVHSIPPEEQDPELFNKILNELDAIATTAFYVYKQLMQNNFLFSGDDAYYEHLADVATASTSCETIKFFSDTFCDFDGVSFTSTEALFTSYNAAFPNVPFKDSSAFSRAFLEENYGKIEPKRKHTSNSNLRGFCGVALKGASICI